MQNRRSLPPYEDELSLALLRSADQDEPSAAAYSKVAAALGVSAAVGLGASLPAQAVLASNGLSGSALARWSSSLFAKVVVVGVSGVMLASGGIALLRHRSPSKASALAGLRAAPSALGNTPATVTFAPSSPPQAAALASAVPTPTPTISTQSSSESSTSLSAVRARAAAVPALAPVAVASKLAFAQSASAVHVSKASSLPEQVSSLDRARVALNSGDAGAALAEIAHYRSTWPRGVFLTEASVLEIEALAKRGEIVLAGMRAQAFVTAHPDSPQADRLRALIPSQAP